MDIKDFITNVEAFFIKVPTKVRYKMSKGGSCRWWWLDSNQLKLLLPFFYHLIENASMT